MSAKPILAVGSLNMDQVVRVKRLPVMGETLLGAGSLQLVPGGKGANQAVAMARLGATVNMAGRVGDDPFGAQLLQALRTSKVNHDLVFIDNQEASGVAFIFLSATGENAIVVAPGANMRVGDDTRQNEQILAALPAARALVLQLEIPLETVKTLIAAGHQVRVPVILNLAPASALPLETLRQLDVLVVNETEACLLRDALSNDQETGSTLESLSDAFALARDLQSRGIASVVITLGAQGALLVSGQQQIHVPAPRVQVVDTTAAGDCFTGAFTVALTEGQEMARALDFAIHASALKVTKFGAQSGLPTRAEVEAIKFAQ